MEVLGYSSRASVCRKFPRLLRLCVVPLAFPGSEVFGLVVGPSVVDGVGGWLTVESFLKLGTFLGLRAKSKWRVFWRNFSWRSRPKMKMMKPAQTKHAIKPIKIRVVLRPAFIST